MNGKLINMNENLFGDKMIKDKPVVDPSIAKKLLLMFIDEPTKKLGIPVISDVNTLLELLELRKNFILFATTPDVIKNAGDNIIVVKDLKKGSFEKADDSVIEVDYLKKAILAALESNQKIVLAYEALSNPKIKEVLNNPEKLRLIRGIDIFPETVKKELDIIIEIKEKYKDRFEVEPIGVSQNDIKNLSKEEAEKYVRRIIVEEALDLFKKCKDTIPVLLYTGDGILSVSDILDEIEKNMKEGKKIIDKKDIARICVFVPPNVFTPPKNQDLSGVKRE
jgi:hypothetical protein